MGIWSRDVYRDHEQIPETTTVVFDFEWGGFFTVIMSSEGGVHVT